MSIYKSSTLAMIPTAYKDGKLYSVRPTDGSGDFTFSRGSNLAATRVASSGYIEKGRENLLLQSNTFNTTWVKVNTTLTSGQAGYDGTNDAWLVDKSAASARIEQYVSASGVQTLSAYAKAGSLNWTRLNVDTDWAYYDLANGVVGTATGSNIIDHSIEDAGGGWYRCVLVVNRSITTARIYPADADNNSGGTSGNIYIQDAQLESGLVSTSVIETTTTSASAGILEDMPRLDYSGGASCPALLLEPQRTNLVTQSEYFGAWVDAGTTTILSTTTNPSGYSQSYIISAASSATNALRYDLTFSASTDYSYSLFLKAGTSEEVRMQIYDGNTFKRLAVNPLNNFAVVDQSGINSYSIEDFSNGWKRVSMNFSSTASAGVGYLQIYPDRTGNLNNVEVYGATLEQGSYPTSYIPTYGSSVTRSVDVCDGAGDADLFNDSQGVLFAEVSFARDRGQSSPFKLERISLSDGTTNNRILISNTTTTNQIQAFIRNSSGTIFSETITLTDITANNKIAVRYESGNYALYINGTQEATGSSSNVPSGLNELMFDGPSGTYNFEGKVKQAIYFPTALTDTELASLTTL